MSTKCIQDLVAKINFKRILKLLLSLIWDQAGFSSFIRLEMRENQRQEVGAWKFSQLPKIKLFQRWGVHVCLTFPMQDLTQWRWNNDANKDGDDDAADNRNADQDASSAYGPCSMSHTFSFYV